MTFWDGTRWVDEDPRPSTAIPSTISTRKLRHLKDWLATGVMAVVLVAMAVPFVGTSAASLPSGTNQVARWTKFASMTMYSEANTRIKYDGKWRRADHPGHMGGHVRFSDLAGSKASLAFKGLVISWIGPVGPTRGKADVYIDGAHVKTVNTYASSFQPARVLFKMRWSEIGTHRIEIVALGTDGHPTVALDTLAVRTSKRVRPKPDTKPKPAATNAPQGTPRVLLSEDIGPAGTETRLTLSGFAGGSTGAIDFDGSTRGMPTYTTASDGTAKVIVTIPLDATPGQHEINTRGPDGDSLMMRIFEVTAPADELAATAGPTLAPTPSPTSAPTSAPTPAPTAAPTSAPTSAPTPAPTAAPTSAPTSAPTPAPTAPPTATYAATFSGDATGATDVTAALRTFLQSHNGSRVALATNGVYKVTQLSFTASNLTVDFRGARLQANQAGAHGILRIVTSSNIVLNDPKVYGTGYVYTESTQWEHGIHVDGGSNITLNRPYIRNTRGDGILTGYDVGKNQPPTGVVINDPNIERAARNGIAPVGGEVTIRGGHIAYAGLHGIDFEPNDAIEASSIRGVVDGVDIRHVGDLPAVGYPGYGISAGWGYLGTSKPSLVFENNTGDKLSIVVMKTSTVRIVNNASDSPAIADITTSTNITFSGNIRITRQ